MDEDMKRKAPEAETLGTNGRANKRQRLSVSSDDSSLQCQQVNLHVARYSNIGAALYSLKAVKPVQILTLSAHCFPFVIKSFKANNIPCFSSTFPCRRITINLPVRKQDI